MINTAREERDIVVPVMYFLIGYSLFVHFLTWMFGYYLPPENIIDADSYHGYLRKPNWSLYPIFYTISLFALRLSWSPFLKVWEKLIETKVISIKSHAKEDEVSGVLVRYVKSWRWLCVTLAIVSALILNYLPFKNDIWNMYTANTYEEQMKIACKEPNYFGKWLFAGDSENAEGVHNICLQDKCGPFDIKDTWKQVAVEGVDSKFMVKVRGVKSDCNVGSQKPSLVPGKQKIVAIAVYAQQFIMAILACLFLFQILLHPVVFAFFEKTGVANKYDLRIELNAESNANEFGLEHWNHALNNVYWFLSMGLLVPIVSRLSQPNPNDLDLGQNVIRVSVSLLVFFPMIATVISRQVKLPSLWENLSKKKNPDAAWKAYHEQRLWPLDKNWSSKFGIIVALALASFLLGAEILKVTGL